MPYFVSTHSRPKAAGFLVGNPFSSGKFQHTAARRRLDICWIFRFICKTFQHTAARRRLEPEWRCRGLKLEFQHTAARRRLGILGINIKMHFFVSTHSRPKAAGARMRLFCWSRGSFNTQPPEGGWQGNCMARLIQDCFNTQPPEGGWTSIYPPPEFQRCFNTQPPEGGWFVIFHINNFPLSFNTQPPEGGWKI